MKIRFLQDVIISNKYNIDKGEIFQAEEYDEDSYAVRMRDNCNALAPKMAEGDIYEVIKE